MKEVVNYIIEVIEEGNGRQLRNLMVELEAKGFYSPEKGEAIDNVISSLIHLQKILDTDSAV